MFIKRIIYFVLISRYSHSTVNIENNVKFVVAGAFRMFKTKLYPASSDAIKSAWQDLLKIREILKYGN